MPISPTQDTMSAKGMQGGFIDPVFDSQSVFDSLMNAMARPGSIVAIKDCASAPDPIVPAVAAIVQTLCDSDTPVWLDAKCSGSEELRTWIAFYTGASIVDHNADGHFLVVSDASAIPNLSGLAQGSQQYPDRSTTLIVQVDSLETGGPINLTGPGVNGTAAITINSLPPYFVSQWHENQKRYPCGVDIIFASPNAVVCLPRTTTISVKEA